MARKKTPDPIHPLRMAAALEQLNERVGMLLMRIENVRGLSDKTDAEALRALLATIADEADRVREVIWPEEAA